MLGKHSVIELHAQQGDDIMKPDDKGLHQARQGTGALKQQRLGFLGMETRQDGLGIRQGWRGNCQAAQGGGGGSTAGWLF